jgi:hypothetical protein
MWCVSVSPRRSGWSPTSTTVAPRPLWPSCRPGRILRRGGQGGAGAWRHPPASLASHTVMSTKRGSAPGAGARAETSTMRPASQTVMSTTPDQAARWQGRFSPPSRGRAREGERRRAEPSTMDEVVGPGCRAALPPLAACDDPTGHSSSARCPRDPSFLASPCSFLPIWRVFPVSLRSICRAT